MSHKIDPWESNAIIPRKDYERLLKCEAACAGLKDPEEDIESLILAFKLILPFAKGYVAKNKLLSNQRYIEIAESALAKFEGVKGDRG